MEENISNRLKPQPENTKMYKDSTLKFSRASDYLCSIASHIPDELISTQNFAEIKNIADKLRGGLTSFFGFESRLTSTNARSDYLVAVSSMKSEREDL